ncbi:hypothetical protein GDO81_019017 [Engystomops pustulosus]|uniref:Uncharacterized protein n=1 Tax=Engystomops pustulosus TaxID=76066 RepID=A0AAV6YZW0_ENGPU|nr:hypothetical protein GDO81_019017 [Engystomops pustulosus]
MKIRQIAAHLPPGPTPLPLIGNLFTTKCQLNHKTLMKLSKIYGNIMTIWAGQTSLIVLNGYEAIRECLINNSEKVSDRPTTPFFKYYSEGRGSAIDAEGACTSAIMKSESSMFCLLLTVWRRHTSNAYMS